MIENLISLLLQNTVIKNYVSNEICTDAIFYEFKPKLDITDYIILKEKPLNIGLVEEYQIDVLIFGKDFQELIKVEREVRKELNDKKGTKIILNNDTPILDLTMLVGGGRQYDEKLGRFISLQYFKVTI